MPRRALTYDSRPRITGQVTTDDLIEVMQEEQEIIEYRDVLESLRPKTREKFLQIQSLLRAEMQTMLDTRYQLGELFLEMYQDETAHGAKVYGKHAISKICKLLSLDDDFVRSCMKFVQTFTRDQLVHLCSQVLPRGEPISWSHIHSLLSVKDASKRNDLLQRTVTDGLTCTELAYEVKQLQNHRRDDKRGRPMKTPSGYEQALQQLMQMVETWDRRYINVWNDQRHSILSKANELQADQVTEHLLCETSLLAHRLHLMAQQVRGLTEKTEKAACNLEKKLRTRGIQNELALTG